MMKHIEIARPQKSDKEAVVQLFAKVITDTYVKEGLGDRVEVIQDEIDGKTRYLEMDFESNGTKRHFLIAKDQGHIIGTIEFGKASPLIHELTVNRCLDIPEIGTVFVDPEYHNMGIGSLLLKCIFLVMQSKNIERFCLDSGYTIAKKIWTKKLGDPNYIFKNHWGEGYDHLIWIRELSEMVMDYPILKRNA